MTNSETSPETSLVSRFTKLEDAVNAANDDALFAVWDQFRGTFMVSVLEREHASYDLLVKVSAQLLELKENGGVVSAGGAKGRKTKTKVPRPAGEPKRPSSSYIRFVKETVNRDQAKANLDQSMGTTTNDEGAEVPAYNNKDVTKELGRMWQALTDAEKKPYQDQFEEARKQYTLDIAAFKSANPELYDDAGKPVATGEDAPAPRRRRKPKVEDAGDELQADA